jgi:hypothetical protein
LRLAQIEPRVRVLLIPISTARKLGTSGNQLILCLLF